MIKYERGFEKDIYISCHQCEGKLFDHNIDEVKSQINGMNIIDVYDTELKELSTFFNNTKINTILETIHCLGISHLKLNRKTQSLSGGEMRRIKLCEILSKSRKTNKILFIDEPVAGLDSETDFEGAEFYISKI
ncbi:ATP-binding cassette domain-containing protein [Klebsiella variicola subsp. variicola]|nr:ATP-binding cassette domain-containing protein [Klebsiella variicola subsp. variicola]